MFEVSTLTDEKTISIYSCERSEVASLSQGGDATRTD